MFTVRFIDEDALPENQAWVIGVTAEGRRFLFIKHGARSAQIIEDAWEGGLLLNSAELRVAV